MPTNIFVIARSAETDRLLRVPIIKEIQDSLEVQLEGQATRFLSADIEEVEYSPGYSPSEDEVFRQPSFQLPPYLSEGLDRADAVPILRPDDLRDDQIRATVCAMRDSRGKLEWVLFQKVVEGQILYRGRRWLVLAGNVFSDTKEFGVRIGRTPTALWRGGVLYFEKERAVASFLDLSSLFAEASDEKLGEFARLKLWAESDVEWLKRNADRWTRRKISEILYAKRETRIDVGKAMRAAQRYGVTIEKKAVKGTDRIVLPRGKKELKQLLRLVDGDLFTSEVTGESFQTNSKRNI